MLERKTKLWSEADTNEECYYSCYELMSSYMPVNSEIEPIQLQAPYNSAASVLDIYHNSVLMLLINMYLWL